MTQLIFIADIGLSCQLHMLLYIDSMLTIMHQKTLAVGIGTLNCLVVGRVGHAFGPIQKLQNN